MPFFLAALDTLFQLTLLFLGMASCFLGGFSLEYKGSIDTSSTIIYLALGAVITGASGCSLEQMLQITLLGQKPHPTLIAQILLVLCAIAGAEAGMYLGRLPAGRNDTPT